MTRWHLAAKAALATGAAGVAMLGIGHRLAPVSHLLRAAGNLPGTATSSPEAMAPRSSKPAALGINITGIAIWGTSMPFVNLAIGATWLTSNWKPVPPEYEDKDGNLLEIPPGPRPTSQRGLMIPTGMPDGYLIRCTWTGSGRMTVGGGLRLVATGAGHVSFTVPNSQRGGYLVVQGVVREQPLTALDCRGADSKPGERFRPRFVQTLRGYKALRFMDWQNSNANTPVTWATRHTPQSDRVDDDGVSIEDMMALANLVGADPWFVMPWNADDDYVAHFAAMVRDRLPAGRHVYVEVGNEIWNIGFPAGRQARQEGLAEGLDTDPVVAQDKRYAEKTIHDMAIWEKAFAGRPGLVRVASSQHWLPDRARTILGFRDLRGHIDALATSPYFGYAMGGKNVPYDVVLENLEKALDQTIKLGNMNRAIAFAAGKRYIAYEGGQGVTLFADDTTLRRIEVSDDMYRLYKKFLDWWEKDNGDLLMLYSSVTPIQRGSAWGQAEFETSTPADSPKLRAIVEARGH